MCFNWWEEDSQSGRCQKAPNWEGENGEVSKMHWTNQALLAAGHGKYLRFFWKKEFFSKSQGQSLPKKVPTVNVCIHLNGPEYQKYIDLTCTRDFGGISPQLLARVARQLFPYKRLGELRQSVQRGPLELGIPLIKNPDNVPEDGNDRKSMTEWTSAERLKVDLILHSWARSEVDYINGFIKSRHCEGTTISRDKICPPCQEIASDQSFKRSVRRFVCHSLRIYKLILILFGIFRSFVKRVFLLRNADKF